MLYSSAGFLALIIHLIINHDVLWKNTNRELIPAHQSYRSFLFAITIYFISDILWGLLYEQRLVALVHLDTAVYFASMAFSILFWTRFVIDYLKEKNGFARILYIIGWLIFAFQMLFLLLNFFVPVLYSFDAEGNYRAEAARYLTLAVQIAMFLMTSVYAFFGATRSSGTMKLRHRTIGFSSLAMGGFVIAQSLFPLLPLYAIGCLLSSCVLHSFVLENEKEEYRDKLEERLHDNILKGNYYDLLTGLPGMSYFLDLAQGIRSRINREGGRCAFLFLNLSGMKFYNQSHGFAEGDRLLRAFSQLLTGAFGSENCSRFGQDHFVVLAKDEGLEAALDGLFKKWDAMNKHDCPAILVGVYPDSVENMDVSTACDLAKFACDAIRHTYVSSIKYYDTAMLSNAERQQYIISHLDQAIEQRWIQVYYQPIVRAASRQVCDEEALARWIDPQRGFLSPAEFIPILEDAKLIYKLDLYVVDRVLEKNRQLQEFGLHLVPQSVNLSRSDFEACDIVEEIRRRVDDAGLDRSLLTIEITESIVGGDFDFIKEQVERFRALGFPVWMDDFGSGYSCLDVLQSMPVDLIKFDMRFMQQYNHGDKSKIILTELMKMAVGLGIDTVCEGVERADQAEFLRDIGCSKLQGYYYARPMPLEQILERYRTGTQIGFENPAESGYFDAIGRINLYDLAVIANEEEDALQHYFSTVPMAIIEVQNDRTRFVRSNHAYRDFMERAFKFDISELTADYHETTGAPGRPFVDTLRQCCRDSSRSVFEATLPDGAIVHTFMRRIAENPVTGTVAVAVAVLAVTEAKE